MADLLSRPVLRVETRPDGPPRSLGPAVALLCLGVAVAGLVCCVVLAVAVWFTSDTGSFADSTRVGGFAWLLTHGTGVQFDGYAVGLIPLGSVLLYGVLLERGARRAVVRAGPVAGRDVAVAVGVMSLTYAGMLGAGALLLRTEAAQVSLLRAVLAGALLAGVAGTVGLLRGCDLGREWFDRLPEEARAALAGGLVGMLILVVAGGLAFSVSLVVHFPEAVALAEGLGAGALGGLVIALVGACLLPNALLCAGAFLAGPGFSLGQDTLVAPGAVDLGALPTFPLLAAVPRQADGWWLDLLVVTPVLAGAGAGALALLRYPVYSLDRAAARGGLAGSTGGLGFGVLSWLATGAAGPGRLQESGPDVLPVLMVCVVGGLVGGAVAGFAVRWIERARGGSATGERAPQQVRWPTGNPDAGAGVGAGADAGAAPADQTP